VVERSPKGGRRRFDSCRPIFDQDNGDLRKEVNPIVLLHYIIVECDIDREDRVPVPFDSEAERSAWTDAFWREHDKLADELGLREDHYAEAWRIGVELHFVDRFAPLKGPIRQGWSPFDSVDLIRRRYKEKYPEKATA
jgi:hypothetical protein